LDTTQTAEKDLFLYCNMEESVFTDSFVFSLYFFCYEKTEPLDVHLYAFGFRFSVLHPPATAQDSVFLHPPATAQDSAFCSLP